MGAPTPSGSVAAVKPFLLLQIRPEDEAAADEAQAFRRFGGLADDELVAVRIESDGVPEVDLDDWSGLVVGGGPSNVSDDPADKPASQRRFEEQLSELLGRVVARDFPFLGSCYGVGILAVQQGGVVSRRHPEPVGTTTVTLTEAGCADPLTTGLPVTFDAFTGHKESCEELPAGAVLLATSAACPVQMLRIGANVYATQFHAELDVEGLATRIRVYRDAGYFPPGDADALIAAARNSHVVEPVKIWRRFVQRYAG